MKKILFVIVLFALHEFAFGQSRVIVRLNSHQKLNLVKQKNISSQSHLFQGLCVSESTSELVICTYG